MTHKPDWHQDIDDAYKKMELAVMSLTPAQQRRADISTAKNQYLVYRIIGRDLLFVGHAELRVIEPLHDALINWARAQGHLGFRLYAVLVQAAVVP